MHWLRFISVFQWLLAAQILYAKNLIKKVIFSYSFAKIYELFCFKNIRERLWQAVEARKHIWDQNRAWRFPQNLADQDTQRPVNIQTRTWSANLESYRVNDESMCHKWYCIIELVDTDKCILFWSDSNRINIFEYSFQNIKILANSILIINYAFHNWLIWREFPFVWPWF